MYGVFNHGLRTLAGLEQFLGGPVWRGAWGAPSGLVATAGWGNKKYSRRARQVAAARQIPFLCLEDGFLRSVGLGNQDAPLSLVVDEIGVYYDATRASRLEGLIARPHDAGETARARQLMQQWRDGRVSKYNHAREFDAGAGAGLPGRFVLVVDQTEGDASIRYGLADAGSFARMLEAALDAYPDCTVLLKVHPDVFAGRKRGHFDRLSPGQASRVRVLGQDVHPAGLLERAVAVFAVTSQMGFEGLLWGKPVHTFGMPFYAGWGLSTDALAAPARRGPAPLEALAHAALVDYPRYLDPETGLRCAPERVLAHLALQRRMRERFPAQLHALGFSAWKKPIVRDFFQGSTVHFVARAEAVPAHGALINWGTKPLAGTLAEGVATVRLEDGFLRSVGLGAELVRPLSWVVDGEGIYYDASAPSGLETLLQTTQFEPALLQRAAALRLAICAAGVTKYNVGADAWRRPAGAARVILVPGQVESDASIRFGAPGIRRNVALLQAVRDANPHAHVVYKPHPDVRAALRSAGVGEADAHRWCDEVLGDVPFDRLLDEVDEVHVLTSLAGFESLMRGKRVVCYGQPFYSGWGLTEDIVAHPRRRRRLALDQLVAATLLLYPTYVSRTTGKFTSAERALEELMAWRNEAPSRRSFWRRLFARAFRKQ
jgi:capsular polysaccharide export protein